MADEAVSPRPANMVLVVLVAVELVLNEKVVQRVVTSVAALCPRLAMQIHTA
jgi:hypothetical protein